MNTTTFTHDDTIRFENRTWSWLVETTHPSSLLLVLAVCYVILEILFVQGGKTKTDLQRLKQLADRDEGLRRKLDRVRKENKELGEKLHLVKKKAESGKRLMWQDLNELKELNEQDQQHWIHETAKMRAQSKKRVGILRAEMAEIRKTLHGLRQDLEEFKIKDREEKMKVLDMSEETLKIMKGIVKANIQSKASKGSADALEQCI